MYTPKDYKGVIPLNAIPELRNPEEDHASIRNHDEDHASIRNHDEDQASKERQYVFIKRNAIKCKKCGKVIESWRQHDFVSCDCGATFVDGGLSYLRRGGDIGDFEDLSESGTANEEEYQEWRKAHVLLEEYKRKKMYDLMRHLDAELVKKS